MIIENLKWPTSIQKISGYIMEGFSGPRSGLICKNSDLLKCYLDRAFQDCV